MTAQEIGSYIPVAMSGALAVLTEFEAGCCAVAIESITRLGKPIAEVCTRRIEESRIPSLESDLLRCLESSGQAASVKGFIRRVDEARVSFGFFTHPWALEALEYLDQHRSQIEARHVDWIEGLLFGYQADAIQAFLSARFPESVPTLQHRGDSGMEGTFRPGLARSAPDSMRNSRYRIVDTSDQYVRS